MTTRFEPLVRTVELGLCFALPWGKPPHRYLDADCQGKDMVCGMETLAEITTRHRPHANFFGRYSIAPQIKQIVRQIPPELKRDTVAFEVLSSYTKLHTYDGERYYEIQVRLYRHA